jgi:hypothetical protein
MDMLENQQRALEEPCVGNSDHGRAGLVFVIALIAEEAEV